MSNALVPQDLVEGPLSTDFAAVTAGADYLPRLQLYGAKSNACAEGRIPIGHYGLVKDDIITDLGDIIEIVVVSWRAKALDTSKDTPSVNYDPTTSIFKDIMERSFIKDSGCLYGPEFLVWIPSVNTFATYHMNSKTARREAKKMEPLVGRAATLKQKLIDPPNNRHKWHGPVILPCSTPQEMPSEENMRQQWAKFQNPPAPEEIEVAQGGEDERAR